MRWVFERLRALSLPQLLLLVGSVGLLLFTRISFVTTLPPGLTHDETIYAINAASYSQTGKDISQSHYWWELQPDHPMYAELPARFMALGFLLFEDPIVATRFFWVVMGVLFPIVFGWLVYGMFGDFAAGLAAFGVAVISPLHWQFSHLAYDAPFSVFFYVLGGALFLNLTQSRKLFSVIPFYIGFFGYQGFKPLLIVWVLILFAFVLQKSGNKLTLHSFFSRHLRYSLAVVGAVVALYGVYGLVILPNQEVNNRLRHLVFFDDAISTTVNNERRLSLPSPFARYTSNKATEIGYFMLNRLVATYNPELLLLLIEPHVSSFSVWTHGIFYVIDAVFLLVGVGFVIYAYSHTFSGLLLPLSLPILAFPALVNADSEWYLLRGMFGYMVLLLLISVGVWQVWKSKKKMLRIFIGLGLFFSVLMFSYEYYFRYPVSAADGSDFDERVVSSYVKRLVDEDVGKVYVHTATSDIMLFNYLLYSGNYLTVDYESLGADIRQHRTGEKDSFEVDEVVFTGDCINDSDTVIAEAAHGLCADEDSRSRELGELANVKVPSVSDSGGRFYVLNDTLCEDYKLSSYVRLLRYDQFKVEQMNDADFCVNWLTSQ